MPHPGEIDVNAFMQKNKKIPMLRRGVEYVGPKEYAKIINAHLVTVYRWLDAGQIEGAMKVGRSWKIPLQK